MPQELIGIIGGSGIGDALAGHIEQCRSVDVETPFGKPSDSIIIGTLGRRKIAFLNRHGPGHKLSPSEVPFAANIFALKELGVHSLISTAAVGSLREEIAPGNLVAVDQFIDKTFRRQSSFFASFGAVHCEMAQPICSRLHKAILSISSHIKAKTHARGTYVCMEGPQFSTRAESLMHRNWGGDLIGMTAMPEAKLAREAQICYAMIALVSDYDCWRETEKERDKQTLLSEILGNLQNATNNCLELIKAVLSSSEDLVFENCCCRKSLALAVWTQDDKIDLAQKAKLRVLFK